MKHLAIYQIEPDTKLVEPRSTSCCVQCDRPGEGSSEKNCCW